MICPIRTNLCILTISFCYIIASYGFFFPRVLQRSHSFGLSNLKQSEVSFADKNIFLIESPDAFVKSVSELSSCDEIAVDLEFDHNSFSYGFHLCLIQVYGKGKSYIFDPVALKDISQLLRLFEDNSVTKIFHSPSEDLKLIHKFNCYPKNIYDTETASKILNDPYTALSTLLQNYLNITVDKSQQVSNWLKRPLSSQQIEYAANDVIHLMSLRDALNKKAIEKNVTEWIKEENLLWESYRPKPKVIGSFITDKDMKRLSPFNLYIFNALLAERDNIAESINKPDHYVISKDALIDIAFNTTLPYDIIKTGNHLNHILHYHKVHWKMRKYANVKRFQTVFIRAMEQAEKLGLEQDFDSYTKKRVAEEKRISKLVDPYYIPIYNALTLKYGEVTARFIFARTYIERIFSNGDNFDVELPNYRRQVILEIAKDCGIDIESESFRSFWFGSSKNVML